MAKIVPFRALRYDPAVVKELDKVMAPPYDVISPALQENLYSRSPYNVVRLILGKTSESDTETDNRYTRAAADFQRWQQDGVLVRDALPSIYIYDQEYPVEGQGTVKRHGFMALARLEDFSSGVIKPHEKTLAAPKSDRLNLSRACKAHFSPIFSLYSDPCCVLESLMKRERERLPDIDVVDDDGVKHRLWQVSDMGIIAKARGLLDNKPLFIADGHHRYEVALEYRNMMREKLPGFTGKELFNYVPMFLANMDDQGMFIYPTHRLLVGLKNLDIVRLLTSLGQYFIVERRNIDPADPLKRRDFRLELEQKGKEGHTIGLYVGGGEAYLLTMRDLKVMDEFFDSKTTKALRTLDVSILHRFILEKMLQVTPEAQEQQTHLHYVRKFDETFGAVDNGECQLAFLMNATRMSEVRDVANAGEKMPQKSTYFYPKLLTGLLIDRIFDGETIVD